MSKIILRSSDGDDFEVDIPVAMLSVTIKHMLLSCNLELTDNVVPLPNVDSKTLQKVLEWAKHHSEETGCASDNSEWDKVFLHENKDLLVELMNAADYLDINYLFKITVKAVTNKIQGKSTGELQELFNVAYDPSTDDADYDLDLNIGDLFNE